MNLDDLKERLASIFLPIWEKIQETPAYGQLKDRFDSLSPKGQKAVLAGAIAFAFLIVLSIPLSWFSESQLAVNEFNSRRNTIRDLFQVSREVNETPSILPAPALESLKIDIENRMRNFDITPEQTSNLSISSGTLSQLIPADRAAGGITAALTKLNLDQIIGVGTILSGLSQSIKVTSLKITASKEGPGYFDATFKVTALKVPDLTAASPEEGQRR